MRGTDNRLMPGDEDEKNISTEDEGGLQQQRHPGLPEEMTAEVKEAEQGDLFNRVDDESDSVADKKIMDRLSSVARTYGVDKGMERERDDLLPGI